jgi:choline-sulfatase
VKKSNVLLIQSDQHNPALMGCSGNSWIKTPALDALAERGTRFTNAYCPSPICVPSRASMATGRYPHQTGNWDNAAPYVGTEADSWGHRVANAGMHVTTIGKLHFRREGDPSGFMDQRMPMHVLNGTGDLYPLLRGDAEPQEASRLIVAGARAGESDYTRYDRRVAQTAVKWLREESQRHENGWVLYVSFVCPHFPLIAPHEFYDKYDTEDVPMPLNWSPDQWPMHPAVATLRRLENLDRPFSEEEVRRAVVAYHAMVSFVDQQIGLVLDELRDAGLEETTRVIYNSDHGDMVGQHGLWSKHSMYEGSVAVPMIMAGPEVPVGHVVDTNVSLVDIFPTILDATHTPLKPEDEDLPGESLLTFVDKDPVERAVFSEYHANYSSHASFMLKAGDLKYIYHVSSPPQVFNVRLDPDEVDDLAARMTPEQLSKLEAKLRTIVDPEKVDELAKRSGAARIEAAGGREAVIAQGLRVPYSPAPE